VEIVSGLDLDRAKPVVGETINIGTASDNELTLSDQTVSGYHLELKCARDEIVAVDHDSTNGTYVGAVRLGRAVIPPGTMLRLGKTTLRVLEGEGALVDLHVESSFGSFSGRGAGMRRVMAVAAKAAQSNAPVLITGESGTGKEVLARSIHDEGLRKGKPFIVVDCGALSPTLVGSELFGHERGAFTGAEAQHSGAFERAEGGTLFLDEIGELAPDLQPLLLGVLERKTFRRLGGKKELSTNVRIIAATHRDLRSAVNAGRFRLDLFFRLAVLRIELEPLRQHLDDLQLLVESFLRQAGADEPASTILDARTLQRLKEHHWPGNVRELRNFVEASLSLGEPASLDLFPGESAPTASAASPEKMMKPSLDAPYREARQALLDGFEPAYLERLMERSQGNVSAAARLAKMDRSHLLSLLRRHGLRSSKGDSPGDA
jgi:DNA-binding NtrC family response regulator